jgi:hypothetical protein
MSRFTISQAARGALPLFVGLAGCSGSGKTFSALRLATGIKSVVGGEIGVIDTEANRALHYTDQFKFLHLPFAPPFAPDDYWEAIQVCIKAGCKTVVIDSMSHEHEGPGGVLEMHEEEVKRIAAAWRCPLETAQFPAWAEPKAQRRRLVNNILQVQVNLVVCFRAKRKVKMVKNDRGKNVPTDQGWMPIAGEEYFYELSAMGVLPPGSNGVPDWLTQDPGSETITKRPIQFQEILKPGAQLSEEMGAAMARWSSGAKTAPKSEPPQNPEVGSKVANLLKLAEICQSEAALKEAKEAANALRAQLSKDDKKKLADAFTAAAERLAEPAPEPGRGT